MLRLAPAGARGLITTREAHWGHHQRLPVRVYSEDDIQKDRIVAARRFVSNLVKEVMKEHRKPRIVELGCGTGDITGPFAEYCTVQGLDVANQQIEKARERFPLGKWIVGPAEECVSGPWDILVMCEFLEHLVDPISVIKFWMPNAGYSIVSHPLDENPDSNLSRGDHVWSYDEEDFNSWFETGGHELMIREVFPMGEYNICLGWGKRKESKKEN